MVMIFKSRFCAILVVSFALVLQCEGFSILEKLKNVVSGIKNSLMTKLPARYRGYQKRIGNMLKNQHFSRILKEGASVELFCRNSLISSILRQLERPMIGWSFNGNPLRMDPRRMYYRSRSLQITSLQNSDSGVYGCHIQEKTGFTAVVGLYSFVVKTNQTETLYVNEDSGFKLDCHSRVLGNFYQNTAREWKTESNLILLTQAAFFQEPDRFNADLIKYPGVWICAVRSSKTSRVWYTAWRKIKFEMEETPNVFEKLFKTLTNVSSVKYWIVLTLCVLFLIFVCCNVFVTVLEEETKKKTHMSEFMTEQLTLRIDELSELTGSNVSIASRTDSDSESYGSSARDDSSLYSLLDAKVTDPLLKISRTDENSSYKSSATWFTMKDGSANVIGDKSSEPSLVASLSGNTNATESLLKINREENDSQHTSLSSGFTMKVIGSGHGSDKESLELLLEDTILHAPSVTLNWTDRNASPTSATTGFTKQDASDDYSEIESREETTWLDRSSLGTLPTSRFSTNGDFHNDSNNEEFLITFSDSSTGSHAPLKR